MVIELPTPAEMFLRACRREVRERPEPSDGAVAGELGTFCFPEIVTNANKFILLSNGTDAPG
jgi:hypothetical protein